MDKEGENVIVCGIALGLAVLGWAVSRKWEHMQKVAYETAKKSHTWEHRAGALHKEILSKIR